MASLIRSYNFQLTPCTLANHVRSHHHHIIVIVVVVVVVWPNKIIARSRTMKSGMKSEKEMS